MKAHIFHNIDSKTMFTQEGSKPENFNYVGSFEVDAISIPEFLNATFENTNSIENHWSENDGVIGGKNARSSSVGDLFLIDKKYLYMVNVFGFKDVFSKELIDACLKKTND
jgi:hypothetical protein